MDKDESDDIDLGVISDSIDDGRKSSKAPDLAQQKMLDVLWEKQRLHTEMQHALLLESIEEMLLRSQERLEVSSQSSATKLLEAVGKIPIARRPPSIFVPARKSSKTNLTPPEPGSLSAPSEAGSQAAAHSVIAVTSMDGNPPLPPGTLTNRTSKEEKVERDRLTSGVGVVPTPGAVDARQDSGINQPVSEGSKSEPASPKMPRSNSATTTSLEKTTQAKKSHTGKQLQTLLGKSKSASHLASEAPSQAQLSKFVNGPLDVVMNVVIFTNACIMFLQTEWQGAQAGYSLGQGSTFWPGADKVFEDLDKVFVAIYTIELILRLTVLKRQFFWDTEHKTGFCYANIFDFILVMFVYADIFVMASVDAPKLGVLRFLRMAKLARALRLVRILKAFTQLRLLTYAIASSLPAFLWSMAILLVLNVVAGMILTQVLNEFVMDPTNDRDTRQWVNRHYGSGVKATYTMFEATHSGCWPNYATPLIDHVSPGFAFFWMLYVGAVIFAIIKIITAVFIGETMKAAQADAVTAVSERMKASSDYINRLKDIFETADVSGDGELSRAEFKDMLSIPSIRHYLSHLDLEVHDAEGLFDLLDDGDGQVTLAEFVSGMERMKGQARSADLVSLMHESKITREQGKEILRTLVRMDSDLRALAGGEELAYEENSAVRVISKRTSTNSSNNGAVASRNSCSSHVGTSSVGPNYFSSGRNELQ